MSDRELLELAARAAGINGPVVEAGGMLYITSEQSPLGIWAPLTDDGDALRLAVKLNLSIVDYKNSDHIERRTSVKVWEGSDAFLFMQELHGSDPYAATRRAIVRAAAELGRTPGDKNHG